MNLRRNGLGFRCHAQSGPEHRQHGEGSAGAQRLTGRLSARNQGSPPGTLIARRSCEALATASPL